jgi:hypothetical protein
MWLPIITVLIIIGLVLICASLHEISKKEIRYPATFEKKKVERQVILDCLEEML